METNVKERNRKKASILWVVLRAHFITVEHSIYLKLTKYHHNRKSLCLLQNNSVQDGIYALMKTRLCFLCKPVE